MQPRTYFGYIDAIRHDNNLIAKEKVRLDRAIRELSGAIKKSISLETAPNLLLSLAMGEIRRVSEAAHQLSEHRVSDFAGQARYLRALCASVPFDQFYGTADPQEGQLLGQCDLLWTQIANREMINGINTPDRSEHRKRHIAATMSLLSAFQLEIVYVEQAEERLTKLFGPFSKEVIEPLLGLSVIEIRDGMRAIRTAVLDRLNRAQDLLEPLREAWHKYGQLVDKGASDREIEAMMAPMRQDGSVTEGMVESREIIAKLLVFRPDEFDVLPKDSLSRLFQEFSFVPGQVNQQFCTPFDSDIVRTRPFARLRDGSFLLLDNYYSAFSPLYRLQELFETDKLKQRLLKVRDRVLEEDAHRLLCDVTKPTSDFANYFLPIGTNHDFAERDTLIVKDKVALVAECKAKPLRDVGEHRGNISKIASDVKKAIQAGYDQTCSVINHLRHAQEEVRIWADDTSCKRVLATIAPGEIDQFLPIVVLDSYYGEIATDLEPWLQVQADIGFPWVVDRDTLESILWLIDDASKLIGFLHWRRNLHGTVINEDEAVFAGFYLRHGAADVPDKAALIQLDASYGDVFEAEYYRRQGVEVEFDFPTEVTPPVWTSMSREGDSWVYRIDDQFHDSINLVTGETHSESVGRLSLATNLWLDSAASGTLPARRGPRRNDRCPCGSGRKFKNCCMDSHFSS